MRTMLLLALCLIPLAAYANDEPAKEARFLAYMDSGRSLQTSLMAAQDTPRRVVKIKRGKPLPFFEGFVEFIKELDRNDIVLIGEEHDDPASHRLEWDIVHSIEPNAIGMEMFERDVQPVLDTYLNDSDFGSAHWADAEKEFLAKSRPWGNYPTDYRPIIEFSHHFLGDPRVYASNCPTSIARRVAKEGLDNVLESLKSEERNWVAETTTSPKDEYWQKFLEAMSGGGSASNEAHGMGMSEDQIYSFYQAQCLKDDTMAESIARLREVDPQRQVVHLSGSFHIDYHLGIYPRLVQRRPQDKIVTVALRPVDNFDDATLQAALDGEPGVADYVVFVLREAKPEAAPAVPSP